MQPLCWSTFPIYSSVGTYFPPGGRRAVLVSHSDGMNILMIISFSILFFPTTPLDFSLLYVLFFLFLFFLSLFLLLVVDRHNNLQQFKIIIIVSNTTTTTNKYHYQQCCCYATIILHWHFFPASIPTLR